MLNLIKKDILLQKHLFILYIGLVWLYIYLDIPLFITIILTSSLFVLHSHYYDEKDKSNLLLNSLPFSRKEIVSSKYVEAILIFIPVSIINYIGQFIFNRAEFELSISTIIGALIGTMLFTAFYLPFFYRFKQQYLIILMSGLIGILAALMPAIVRVTNKYFSSQIETIMAMNEFQLYSLVGIVCLLLYALSWKLTVSIYSKRSF